MIMVLIFVALTAIKSKFACGAAYKVFASVLGYKYASTQICTKIFIEITFTPCRKVGNNDTDIYNIYVGRRNTVEATDNDSTAPCSKVG